MDPPTAKSQKKCRLANLKRRRKLWQGQEVDKDRGRGQVKGLERLVDRGVALEGRERGIFLTNCDLMSIYSKFIHFLDLKDLVLAASAP